ncbi:restriction endonuclease subunit S domain-containing protein [Spirosoma koreense]
MVTYWINSEQIIDKTYIPKFYNPEITEGLNKLSDTHDCLSIKQLINDGILYCTTGDEIGKNAYGTGDIPFVRTSDIANWEIKAAPKQGVSRNIYDEFVTGQDVQEGDILFVKDGTYLIGNNCFITNIDNELLFQSHIYKLRTLDKKRFDPAIIFLLLNSEIVQKQIRSFQFTADIIDTIGKRFFELILPFPLDDEVNKYLVEETQIALKQRVKGKAFIKNASLILEESLIKGTVDPINKFLSLSDSELSKELCSETVTKEFGEFEAFTYKSDAIIKDIYLPKYYDPTVDEEIEQLRENCSVFSFKDLKEKNIIEYHTGDEIGKMAYGTGNIPFIRTSDFSNWEINHQPKQGISEEIYLQYKDKQDVKVNDILLVRDGTYLVGSSCIITEADEKSLFCGGLYKIRIIDTEFISPYLFLALINSYIVKRQIRTKQFTRDVIDTIGNRIDEVFIPIPNDRDLKERLTDVIKDVVTSRVNSRDRIKFLSQSVINPSLIRNNVPVPEF